MSAEDHAIGFVKLDVWRGREFRDMNKISGIRIVSLEFPGRAKGGKKAPGRAPGLGKGFGRGAAGKAGFIVIKTERLPDGRAKTILKDKVLGSLDRLHELMAQAVN